MAQATSMSSTERRWLLGANVALTSVMALAIAGLAVWAAGAYGTKFGWQVDLTRSGVNSLSPRTVQLIRGLNEDVTMTGFFTLFAKDARKYAEKHWNRVKDLLDLYQNVGRGRVTVAMVDTKNAPQEVSRILKRLTEKSAYRDESAPHAEAVTQFPDLNRKIEELFKAEEAAIVNLAKADQRLNRAQALAFLAFDMRNVIKDAENAVKDLAELQNSEIPLYGRAVELIRTNLTAARKAITDAQNWMTGEGKEISGISPEARQFFASAAERYESLAREIDAQLDRIKDLKEVKLEEIYTQLRAGDTVLIETPTQAAVVPRHELFPVRDSRQPPNPDGDPYDFAGEQAISSALLKVTQKEKTGVVFVRAGGESLLTPDFSQFQLTQQFRPATLGTLNELLSKENFVTAEWDVTREPSPPSLEGVARVVYVVMPPPPAQQPSPMNPRAAGGITPEQKAAVLDAVKSAGLSIFLAGWEQPQGQFMLPGRYEYQEYLKSTWGVDVKAQSVAIEFIEDPQRPGNWVPKNGQNAWILLTSEALTFTDHAISRPLQTSAAGLVAVAPLDVARPDSRPSGVTIEPLVEVRKSRDIWATSNVQRMFEDFNKRGTRRYEDDQESPFPVAVAATNESNQKCVIVSSSEFIENRVLDAAIPVIVGGTIARAQMFPANGDLFLNAIHWLTGDANRIAVGASQGDIPRLDKLKEGPAANFVRVLLVGIMPALALLVGGAVWFVRRK